MRNFKLNPITQEEMIECYWYPVFDDTIGGWSISNVNQPVSQLNPYEGRFELGSFMTETQVKHIAQIHNAWYQDKVWMNSYVQNYVVSIHNDYVRSVMVNFSDDSEEYKHYKNLLAETHEDLPGSLKR